MVFQYFRPDSGQVETQDERHLTTELEVTAGADNLTKVSISQDCYVPPERLAYQQQEIMMVDTRITFHQN